MSDVEIDGAWVYDWDKWGTGERVGDDSRRWDEWDEWDRNTLTWGPLSCEMDDCESTIDSVEEAEVMSKELGGRVIGGDDEAVGADV